MNVSNKMSAGIVLTTTIVFIFVLLIKSASKHIQDMDSEVRNREEICRLRHENAKLSQENAKLEMAVFESLDSFQAAGINIDAASGK